MSRKPRTTTYPVTVHTARGASPEMGSFATAGLQLTAAEIEAAWHGPASTVQIDCGLCGADQDQCPDLRRILGTDRTRHAAGLVAFG